MPHTDDGGHRPGRLIPPHRQEHSPARQHTTRTMNAMAMEVRKYCMGSLQTLRVKSLCKAPWGHSYPGACRVQVAGDVDEGEGCLQKTKGARTHPPTATYPSTKLLDARRWKDLPLHQFLYPPVHLELVDARHILDGKREGRAQLLPSFRVRIWSDQIHKLTTFQKRTPRWLRVCPLSAILSASRDELR